MKIELLNFNHHCQKVGNYKIGEYIFEVNSQHVENLKKLAQNSNIKYGAEIHDDKMIRSISENSSVKGELVETAILVLDDISAATKSKIYKDFDDLYLSDDIVLILSFLTGRQVFTKKECAECRMSYFDTVVSANYFYSGSSSKLDINKFLNKISDDDLVNQFYNFTFSKSIVDLPSLICYASFTFDAIVTKWCKKNKYSSYNLNNNFVEKAKSYLIQKIEKSFVLGFKNDMYKFLNNQNINSDISTDIVARLNIRNEPSALYKIQKFLENMQMLDNEFDRKYLKILNQVRNKMLHNGQIYKENKTSFEQALLINGSVPFVLLSIIEFYFCKFYLEIDDFHYMQNFTDVKKFLEKGIWSDHKVFEESYEDYLSRMSDEWMNYD